MKTAIEGLQQVIVENELRLSQINPSIHSYVDVEELYIKKQIEECKSAIKVLRNYERAMQWEDN